MKNNILSFSIAILLFCSCAKKPTTGEADMLHGCFKDEHISNLNLAIDNADEMLEKLYKTGDNAKNYEQYVKQISKRKTEDTPIFNPELKSYIERMRDNRLFFELFTMYELDYASQYEAARTGLFDLYLLDYEKPFFKCWVNKTENPIIKSHLENYASTVDIDPMANLWFEVDRLSTVFDSEDFKSPETRMYIAIFNLYHLAYMVNPGMMMEGIDTDISRAK